MKKYLKHYYKKLLNTKTHLWSHIMALIGWGYIIATIGLDNASQNFYQNTNINSFFIYFPICFFIVTIAMTIYFVIPCLILIWLETSFFRKFKIKWAFLIKNPLYNIFWFIGISITTMCTIFVIILLSTI